MVAASKHEVLQHLRLLKPKVADGLVLSFKGATLDEVADALEQQRVGGGAAVLDLEPPLVEGRDLEAAGAGLRAYLEEQAEQGHPNLAAARAVQAEQGHPSLAAARAVQAEQGHPNLAAARAAKRRARGDGAQPVAKGHGGTRDGSSGPAASAAVALGNGSTTTNKSSLSKAVFISTPRVCELGA